MNIDQSDAQTTIDMTDPHPVAVATPPVNPGVLDYASVKSILKAAAEVVVPTGFLVSLAYYFGLVRTRKVFTEMGVDQSLLEFSTTDYLLRSLRVLLVPIPWFVVGAVAAVAWFLSLRRLFRGRKLPLLASVVVVAIGVGAAFWFGLERVHSSGTRPDPDNAVLLFIIVVAVGIVIWTAALAKPHGYEFGDRLPTAAVVAIAAAGVLLLSNRAFEAVRAQALQVGADQALEAQADPALFTCVRVTTDLRLAIGDPVPDGGDGTNGIRTYDGLRMFVKTGGGYFVFDDRSSPRNGLFMIDEDHVKAIQFTPQRGKDFEFCN